MAQQKRKMRVDPPRIRSMGHATAWTAGGTSARNCSSDDRQIWLRRSPCARRGRPQCQTTVPWWAARLPCRHARV